MVSQITGMGYGWISAIVGITYFVRNVGNTEITPSSPRKFPAFYINCVEESEEYLVTFNSIALKYKSNRFPGARITKDFYPN